MNAMADNSKPPEQTPEGNLMPLPEIPGVFAQFGALPPATPITEAGLAKMLGKCAASIKSAVKRGELPWPAKLMGKNTWTAGSIVRHLEKRMESQSKKFSQLRG